MKIFIVLKNSRPDNSGINEPVAALRSGVDGQREGVYSYRQFTVHNAPDELPLEVALAEVAGISQEARDQLGLTFDKVAALNKQAAPDVAINPGDKLYASIDWGDNKMGLPVIKGIYTTPQDIGKESCQPVEVFGSIDDYHAAEKQKAVQKEIRFLTAQTKRVLGLTV